MLKKFIEGLSFGCGFSISFIALWLVAAFTITPMLTNYFMKHTGNEILEKEVNVQSAIQPKTREFQEEGKQFHELSIEEQIQKASVIALAKYEKSADGKMKAVITEFLKKAPDVIIHYKLGDEYVSSSYYPSENRSYGDGVAIFFVGSPASMRMSMGYTGDRITSLADLPIELLRKKCKAPNA